MKSRTEIYLPDVIGAGYRSFWNFTGRYRVVKGSRASKKSKTTALNLIYRMMVNPNANTLVVRKTFRTLKDSCFTELKWAINRLGAASAWQIKESPLEMTLKQTGQKIYFRGLDDPLKVTSITVENGSLCWLWIEEAYEIGSESDFNMLDESIRGVTEAGLFKQITLTFNPWNEHHWIKRRFFDTPDPSTLAITTNYQCNEWLDDTDLKLFESMKRNNPRRYQVAGLGDWGVVDGLVFENWQEAPFDIQDPLFQLDYPDLETAFGLDFGYSNDPTAFFAGAISRQAGKIFVFDEIYKKGLSNSRIADSIKQAGYAKETITADSAEPKSIDELKEMGLRRIQPARKGADSIMNGIQFIQDYKIIVHPRCVNFLTEIGNYTWAKDKFGNKVNRPIDDFNHLMDAMRYAFERHKKITYNSHLKGGL